MIKIIIYLYLYSKYEYYYGCYYGLSYLFYSLVTILYEYSFFLKLVSNLMCYDYYYNSCAHKFDNCLLFLLLIFCLSYLIFYPNHILSISILLLFEYATY